MLCIHVYVCWGKILGDCMKYSRSRSPQWKHLFGMSDRARPYCLRASAGAPELLPALLWLGMEKITNLDSGGVKWLYIVIPTLLPSLWLLSGSSPGKQKAGALFFFLLTQSLWKYCLDLELKFNIMGGWEIHSLSLVHFIKLTYFWGNN